MAEGWGHYLKSDKFNFYSAGTKKHGLNPIAVKVMSEVGVDISTHTSNIVDELPEQNFDLVFTVCSSAHESCPVFPGGRTIQIGFDDPPKLTENMEDEEKILQIYRRVRDEIKIMVAEIEEHVRQG